MVKQVKVASIHILFSQKGKKKWKFRKIELSKSFRCGNIKSRRQLNSLSNYFQIKFTESHEVYFVFELKLKTL